MYDLIYTENHNDYKGIEEIIKKEYPQAKIEDGSDYIHENRFSVEFEIDLDDWYNYLIKSGFCLTSLNFQMEMRQEPDKIKSMIESIKESTGVNDERIRKTN